MKEFYKRAVLCLRRLLIYFGAEDEVGVKDEEINYSLQYRAIARYMKR